MSKDSEKEFSKKLSAKVKAYRISKGIKAKTVADLLKLDQSSYHFSENGKRKFTYYEILMLHFYFKFPLDNIDLISDIVYNHGYGRT